jgi:acyl-CoA thioesterase-2
VTEAGASADELGVFLAALDLTSIGERRWTGTNTADGHGVIFGGQLLAQTIIAASRSAAGKHVRSVHTVFARGGARDHGVTIEVERMHAGRSFASASVSIGQRERLCCRSLVLLDAPDDDLIRHQAPFPEVAPPPVDGDDRWWQVAPAGDVDLMDPRVGPAELAVWIRFPGAPTDEPTAQAMLAYASDGFLIGTAMRPHDGLDQSMAHVSVATTVLTHTVSFHERFDVGDWLLLSQESTYAGGGRAFGRGEVHTPGGRHVASFVQDSMLRAMPEQS